MATFLLWILLFVVAWPVAILALLLYPAVWLLLLPFRGLVRRMIAAWQASTDPAGPS